MSHIPERKWTISETMAAKAYSQARTLGLNEKDPRRCTTEILETVKTDGQGGREMPDDGSLYLATLGIVALVAGAVGAFIGGFLL